MDGCFACMSLCVPCACLSVYLQRSEKALDPLPVGGGGVELLTVVSYHGGRNWTWVLWRSASAQNCWVISPAPAFLFVCLWFVWIGLVSINDSFEEARISCWWWSDCGTRHQHHLLFCFLYKTVMLPDPTPDGLMECTSSEAQPLSPDTEHLLRTHRTIALVNRCNAIRDVFLRLKNGCSCRGSQRMHGVRQASCNIMENKLPFKAVSRSSERGINKRQHPSADLQQVRGWGADALCAQHGTY